MKKFFMPLLTIANAIPSRYKADYAEFRNNTNAMRLPYLFIFIGLQRLSYMLVNMSARTIDEYLDTTVSNFDYYFWGYTLFYFILLSLASHLTKKFKTYFVQHPRFTRAVYVAAIAMLVIDDVILMTLFAGAYNPVSFLAGVAIVALVPVHPKVFTIAAVLTYAVATVILNAVFAYGPQGLIIGGIYYTLVSFLAITGSANAKSKHQQEFLSQNDVKKNMKALRELSETDALTKVSNRRAFDEYFGELWERSKERKHRVAVMMMDVDYFKLYNDHFGHPQGDECLIQVAKTANACFRRRDDMFARYGGEEFVGVMVSYKDDDVMKFSEKIRRKIEEMQLPHPKSGVGPVVTISIGVARQIPTGDLTPEMLIEMADTALYEAKQKGRNQVAKHTGA
ncbi:MAG: GGDEF domain-containing protein [Defluviitaleaceae bacterium]|nr:GGDEF domain-containing protein [Defluviitaleaceae bacterium]